MQGSGSGAAARGTQESNVVLKGVMPGNVRSREQHRGVLRFFSITILGFLCAIVLCISQVHKCEGSGL